MAVTNNETEIVKYHNDGSIWAKGYMLNGLETGYWEWYRKNGVIMRSGYFEAGKQVGDWTTYDKKGNTYKVTHFSFESLSKSLKVK